MSNRNLSGAPKLTLPERPSFMDNLSRHVLDEADQMRFQQEMMKHHIGMLETELRAAQRTLQLINKALRVERDKVEVTLAVFSGRRNPNWSLSEREVEELRRLLNRGFGKPLRKPKECPGLGYSGFMIRNKGRIKGIPEKMDVYRGVITVAELERGREKQTYYEDVIRIELWLAEQAAERGYGDDMEHFGGPSMK